MLQSLNYCASVKKVIGSVFENTPSGPVQMYHSLECSDFCYFAWRWCFHLQRQVLLPSGYCWNLPASAALRIFTCKCLYLELDFIIAYILFCLSFSATSLILFPSLIFLESSIFFAISSPSNVGEGSTVSDDAIGVVCFSIDPLLGFVLVAMTMVRISRIEGRNSVLFPLSHNRLEC